jgi:hypothetical protein
MMAEEAKIMQDATRRVRELLIFLFMSFLDGLLKEIFFSNSLVKNLLGSELGAFLRSADRMKQAFFGGTLTALGGAYGNGQAVRLSSLRGHSP